MSLAIEGASARPANADPIRAADPLNGASLSPWQALMASAALAQGGEAGGWQARIETGPARPSPPVVDDPERIETAARETKPVPPVGGPMKESPASPAVPNPEPPGLFQDGDFSLADLLDVINPLQHIPIVSSLYRELTGDRIGHGARLAGGVLFMGPLGGLSALANIALLEASGKDAGDHALALFKDDPAATALAANSSAPAPESKSAPIADEKALAELLPPGAIPLPGRSVDFTQAALRPPAIAPAPGPAAAENDDLPPPPPPSGPIAGPGWKGFYSPPEPQAASARAGESPRALNEVPLSGRAVPPAGEPNIDSLAARRARAPDPMVALAAKRTPGAMAGALAAPRLAPGAQAPKTEDPAASFAPGLSSGRHAPPGALAVEGGWFSDVMLEALAKYQDAARLRGPQAPEAARQGGVNVVN